jgi:CDP-2,3-bis-(O-geranylgeranyl)-sn-glycerol synthase
MTQLAEGALLVAPLFVGFAFHGVCMRLGWLRGLAVPLDRGATLKGQRLFGDNKTYRGFVCVGLGTAAGFVLVRPDSVQLDPARRLPELALLGLLVGFAAMLAELPNSLLKRRLGIAPGAQTGGALGVAFHLLDQVDVLLGAWAALAVVVRPTPARVLGSIACVYLGHQLVTLLGYRLGMRATAR